MPNYGPEADASGPIIVLSFHHRKQQAVEIRHSLGDPLFDNGQAVASQFTFKGIPGRHPAGGASHQHFARFMIALLQGKGLRNVALHFKFPVAHGADQANSIF